MSPFTLVQYFRTFRHQLLDLDGVPMRLLAAMGERFNRVRRLERIDTKIRVAVVNKVALPSESNQRQRVVACIIWVLSDTPALGDAYLHSKGCVATGTCKEDSSPDKTVLTLLGWLAANTDTILAALVDMENPFRIEADCFLVRSLTAMVVHVQSSKGVLVTTTEAIHTYLRFWSFRPVPAVLQPALRKLSFHRNTRRKFGQLLRREWMLDYGSHRFAPESSNDETVHRALTKRMVIGLIEL